MSLANKVRSGLKVLTVASLASSLVGCSDRGTIPFADETPLGYVIVAKINQKPLRRDDTIVTIVKNREGYLITDVNNIGGIDKVTVLDHSKKIIANREKIEYFELEADKPYHVVRKNEIPNSVLGEIENKTISNFFRVYQEIFDEAIKYSKQKNVSDQV